MSLETDAISKRIIKGNIFRNILDIITNPVFVMDGARLTPCLKFILTSLICGSEDQDIIHENVLDFFWSS